MDKTDEHPNESRILSERYALKSLLGQGGMGKVYLAYDSKLERTIALKLLSPDLVSDEKHTQRFVREVQLAQKINHPNVVKYYDIDCDGRALFITMEHVDGGTLREKILQKSISQAEALPILRQICLGLQAVHEAGLVHRDLKPGNVLIDGSDVIKISDFGVARPEVSELTAHDEIIGCSHYIAPEVWLGKGSSILSDIYALGILAYEIVTGDVPFDGSAPADLMNKHLNSIPYPPSRIVDGITPAFERLILRLIEKDPLLRPQSVAALINELDRISSDSQSDELGTAYQNDLIEALSRTEEAIAIKSVSLPPKPHPHCDPRSSEFGKIKPVNTSRSSGSIASYGSKKLGSSRLVIWTISRTTILLVISAMLAGIVYLLNLNFTPLITSNWSAAIDSGSLWEAALLMSVNLIVVAATLAVPLSLPVIFSLNAEYLPRRLAQTWCKNVFCLQLILVAGVALNLFRVVAVRNYKFRILPNDLYVASEAASRNLFEAVLLLPFGTAHNAGISPIGLMTLSSDAVNYFVYYIILAAMIWLITRVAKNTHGYDASIRTAKFILPILAGLGILEAATRSQWIYAISSFSDITVGVVPFSFKIPASLMLISTVHWVIFGCTSIFFASISKK